MASNLLPLQDLLGMDDVLGDTSPMPVSATLDDLLGPESLAPAPAPVSSSTAGVPQATQALDLLDLLGDVDQV